MERYIRNQPAISIEDNKKLLNSSVCVVGLGGLGGNIIEKLARIGIGHITCIDADVFETTNLNRQLLCTETNIGEPKVLAAKDRINSINSAVSVTTHIKYLNDDNAEKLLSGHDLVIDALDSIESRFVLDKACKHLGIPYIHGAIGGWQGQVAVVFPEDDTLLQIYGDKTCDIDSMGSPAFTPSIVATIQVTQAIKVLLGHKNILKNKFLFINLEDDQFITIDLKQHSSC